MPRYYTVADWATSILVCLIALGVYWGSLASTVTLEYSGALVVAADHFGVSRPPGYPIWHLLARAFTATFAWVSHRGHPNPAWAVNFMSAVFGALACGALALIVVRATRDMFGLRLSRQGYSLDPVCTASAFAAALLFGFGQVMWSQSVIAETHALTNCFMLLFLAVLIRWAERGGERETYVVALLFGFGLSVSPFLILLAPLMLMAALFVSRGSAMQMGGVTTIFGVFLVLQFALGSQAPWVAALILGGVIGAAVLLAIPRRSRRASIMLLLMLVGLLPYLYLPLAASRHPPVNMGNAATWHGFWHVLARGQYERLVPANPFASGAVFKEQLLWYFRLVSEQYTKPILSIALVPLIVFPWLQRSARRSVGLLVLGFALFGIVTLIGANPSMDGQTTLIVRVIFIPSFALLAILIGCGLAAMMTGLEGRVIRVR